MNPKVNFHNLVRQLLPTHRRQPVRLWWLRVLVSPLVRLYVDFVAWRIDVRFRINLTGQVKVLEGYLNMKYDPTQNRIRIVIFDDGLLWVGLECEGDNYHPRIGLESEPNNLAAIPLENEIRDSFGDVDFIVYIPAGVDPDLVRATVEQYRLAGMKFKIIVMLPSEQVSISATTSDGEGDATGQIITVTENDGTVRYRGAIGTGVTLYFQYGTRYRISAADGLARYSAPEDHVYTAETTSRNVSLVYERVVPVTRLIFDRSISDPANITGAGEGAIVDILAKMRRCLVKKTADGEVAIAYLDNANSELYADGTPAVLTGSEGDVMVYKPAFYYKHEEVDANRFAYNISEQPGDGSWIFSPASLIGAYKSFNDGGKLHSWSGAIPSCAISQPYNIACAKIRGMGYNIIDWEQHCMIALLFYAKYGTRDSQAVLGAGNAYYATTNGSTNSRGNADTAATSVGHASFAGIEGVHGGSLEWVAGVEITCFIWTVIDPDGKQRQIGTAPSIHGKYITEIAAANGEHFDLMPIATSDGSFPTHYTDLYSCSSGSCVMARSGYSVQRESGVSYAYTYYGPTATSMTAASRLAFRGVIREADSVAAFKALPIL